MTKVEIESLNRQDLVAAAKAAGFDNPTTTKSEDLRSFLLEANDGEIGKPVKQKKSESPELTTAREVYARARADIRASIEASQKAMKAYRENPDETNKAAYAGARANHAAAIAHIKQVRTSFKNLVKAEDEKAEVA